MKIIGDFQTTVEKALTEIDPAWVNYPGLIVCGTHSPVDWEPIIKEIGAARVSGIPFLGICYGHQLAAIEYARSILGIENATSQEFGAGTENVDKPGLNVVYKLPSLKVGQYDGESYWNYYEVSSGVLEIWKKADNFITVQYHPEYQSSRDKPHPILLQFLYHAKHHAK